MDWRLILAICGMPPLLWLVILQFAAWIGPWARLAARYPVQSATLDAISYYPTSMDCGLMSYGNCLYADVTPTTLTLRPMFIVRPYHPPIALPRAEMTGIQRGKFVFIPWVSFTIGDLRLKLSGSIANAPFWDVGAEDEYDPS